MQLLTTIATLCALPALVQSLSPGCGSNPSLADGEHTVTVNGQEREFSLTLPENYDPENPYRLIFVFHGLGDTMEDIVTGRKIERDTWAYFGLKGLADNSAIFVAPQGLELGWANTNGRDIDFVDTMIETLEADLCIDQDLRFATGFSYGGGMSYAIACARAAEFRAVAPLSGAELSGCDGGTEPIAYFGVHGTKDPLLQIDNGRQLRDKFVAANGCDATEAPEPASGSLAHIKTDYTGCSADHPVRWIAFDGAHIPAPQDGAAGSSGSKTYVPGETWEFFSQFT